MNSLLSSARGRYLYDQTSDGVVVSVTPALVTSMFNIQNNMAIGPVIQNRKWRIRRFVTLGVLIFFSALTGCVGTVPMSRGVPERSFVDIPVPASTRFGLYNYKDLKTFIPIYGDIKRVKTEVARYQLDAKLRESGFDAGVELQKLLAAKLNSHNVQARVLSAERPQQMMRPKVDVASLPLKADTWAVLDARFTGVGLNADMSGEFRPQVTLLVQLLDAHTQKVLYDNRFIYNGRMAKAVRIPYDPGAKWVDTEAIRNDLPGVCAAIVAALDKMAELIAADIVSSG